MSYARVLRYALEMVRRQRALWLFGALLALTAFNGFFLTDRLNQDQLVANNTIRVTPYMTWRFPGEGVRIDLTRPGGPRVSFVDPRLDTLLAGPVGHDIQAILITAGYVFAASLLVALVARYVAEAALIRTVDESEPNGPRKTVARGFRLGFSQAAWRLFLIDLVIHLPIGLILAALLVLALSPLALAAAGNGLAAATGTLATLVLLVVFVTAAFAAVITVSIVRPVILRACAIEGLGVGRSIRRGFALTKARLGDVLVLWLISQAVRLGGMILAVPALVLASPVMAAFLPVGVLAGGVPAAIAGGILSASYQGVAPWIMGVIIGLPIFILITLAPILFLNGLLEAFKSAFWTGGFRELRQPAPASSPSVALRRPTGLEMAPAL